MARRRGTSARTRVTPDGRDEAVNGMDLPGDEPGARTIGAMALKRWVARGPGRGDASDDGGDVVPTHGPFDEEDAGHEPVAVERIDFGAVRLPVPRGGEVSVEPEDGRLQAVHVMLPAGRLSVSALAAPRTERLWPDLAAEIDESLREGGATVRSFSGEWGRELHARTGDASSLFVGVDGPRWMLYGVATGPTSAAAELDAALRTMLRGTVVVRGRSPYPVRTVLPLTVPDRMRPGSLAGPERVPVPRMPAERLALPSRPAPSPMVDAPTTITTVADAVDTVPHGIPRSVPAAADRDDAGRPYRGGPATAEPVEPAAGADPVRPGAETDAESVVSRTASRGLFRRRPERPSARPPQRRVADLVAEAERDRATAERTGSTPARPARPTEADEPAPAWVERPAPDAPGRTNGFVPRELTHEDGGTNGAALNGWSTSDRHEPNGVGYDGIHGGTPGGTYGGIHDGIHDGAPLSRPHTNGSPSIEPRNGHGEPSFDEWSHDRPTTSDHPWSMSDDQAVAPFGAGHRDDLVDDHWGADAAGPVGAIEATVWASMAVGGAHPSSGLAADGSDDWTLPLPVVRPADPEPEPARPVPPGVVPGGRRARREAAEREAREREAPRRRVAGHREPERSPSGVHSADRPRHAGDQHVHDPATDGRVTRRSRHRGERADPGHPAERARHRRPDH